MIEVPFVQERVIGEHLEKRLELIHSAEGLGPADLCYLIFENRPTGLKKLISAKKQVALYHNVIGNKVSTTSGAAAYYNKFLKLRNLHLSKGIYCIFDLFSHNDLCVEAQIPGGISVKVIGSSELEYSETLWQGAFISSVLRYFYSNYMASGVLISPFDDLNDLKYFVETASKFRDRIGVVLGDLKDINHYAKHLIFHAFSKFLMRKFAYQVHDVYFRKLAKNDPLLYSFCVDSCVKRDEFDDVLKASLEKKLENTPSSYLLFSYAKMLILEHKYEQAEAILKNLISKHSDLFTFWETLIRVVIAKQEFLNALICINCAPNLDPAPTAAFPVFEMVHYTHSRSALSMELFWRKPRFYDFCVYAKNYYRKTRADFKLQEKYEQLPASHFKGTTKKLYKCLVEILRYEDWNFIAEQRLKLFKNIEQSFYIEETRGLDTSTNTHHRGNESLLIEKFHMESGSIEPIDLLRSYCSEIEEPGDLGAPRQVNVYEKDSNIDISEVLSNSDKTESPLLNSLITGLYNDLIEITQWQKEVNKNDGLNKSTFAKQAVCGEIWIMRGALAERMNRPRLAEKAYRYATDSGFSLFAWYRLMKVYARMCNTRGALICMIETIKEVNASGILVGDALPTWMEDVLCMLCSGCGVNQLHSTAVETKCMRFPAIMNTIAKIRAWKVDGAE